MRVGNRVVVRGRNHVYRITGLSEQTVQLEDIPWGNARTETLDRISLTHKNPVFLMNTFNEEWTIRVRDTLAKAKINYKFIEGTPTKIYVDKRSLNRAKEAIRCFYETAE